MPLNPGVRLGPYEIRTPLGRGGMGEVYRARDTRLGREVAIKLVLPDLSADAQRMMRFEREARAASGLNDPHIVTVHDVGSSGEGAYIVMELVEGDTLRERLGRGPLTAKETIDISAQIAEGLATAHEAGIIHRDLKPDNVMITRSGLVKILDFGVAKLHEPKQETLGESNTRTAAATVIGTLSYMSPEQSRGDPVDFRSDQFAIGAVMYEMATGRMAFHRRTAAETVAAIRGEEPDPLAEVNPRIPVPLCWIVERCLAKHPGGRYASTHDLAAELKGLRNHLAEAGAIGPSSERRHPAKALRTRPLAAAALGLVVVGALAAWLFGRGRGNLKPAEHTTLAVLPFRALNAADEIGFLGLGIPDAIITRLANVRGIRVRPTTLVLRYAKVDMDLQEAGRGLQSDHVLAGTLQKVEDRLGVSVQLVRVEDGVTVWGERFDVPRADLLQLQETIGARVAAALGVRMTEAERERMHRRYTSNAAAYEHYLRGRVSLAEMTESSTREAIVAFEAARGFDRHYALAHAGLAIANARMRIFFARDPAEAAESQERAKSHAAAALTIDPQLAEAHEALADIYGNTEFDWERTIAESRRALDLNPSLAGPHFMLGRAFYHLGLLDLVEGELRAGTDIDPARTVEPRLIRGNTAFLDGRFAESVRLLDDDGESREKSAEWWLAQALRYAGQGERSEAMLGELLASPYRVPATRARATLASFLAARGMKAQAIGLLSGIRPDTYMDHHVAYAMGVAHAQLGDLSSARHWLGEASATGFPCYSWYERDPLLEPLRGDPEFDQFMAALRRSWEAARVRYGRSAGREG